MLTASRWSILSTVLLPCLHRSLQPMRGLQGWGGNDAAMGWPPNLVQKLLILLLRTLCLALLLWETGLNFLSLIYWSYMGFSSGETTSFVFSPAYFKAFHCLWGGRQWDDDPLYPLQCWWAIAVSPFVVECVRICLCHYHMKTGTGTSVIPAVETGAGGKPELWVICLSAFSLLTSSDCCCESLQKALQPLRYEF